MPAVDVLNRVTYRPHEMLDPILEALQEWSSRSTVIKGRWRDLKVSNEGSTLTIEGFPLHPNTQKRLTRYLLGSNTAKRGLWRDNPDLLAKAYAAAPLLLVADQVQVRVVDGTVVYATDLPQDLGSHLDYFQVYRRSLARMAKARRTPMSLIGYLVDPLWVHVRFASMRSVGKRTLRVGLALDSNYLFTRSVRGRASLGFTGFDLLTESTLTLDGWWSHRTGLLKMDARDDYLPYFEARLKWYEGHLFQRLRALSTRLNKLNDRKMKPEWRGEVVRLMGDDFIGRGALRRTSIDFDARGRSGSVNFSFAVAQNLRKLRFERRVRAERYMAYLMKKSEVQRR